MLKKNLGLFILVLIPAWAYAQTWPITQDSMPLYVRMGNKIQLLDYSWGDKVRDPLVSCSQGSVLKGRDPLELTIYPREMGRLLLFVKEQGDTLAQVNFKVHRLRGENREIIMEVGPNRLLETV